MAELQRQRRRLKPELQRHRLKAELQRSWLGPRWRGFPLRRQHIRRIGRSESRASAIAGLGFHTDAERALSCQERIAVPQRRRPPRGEFAPWTLVPLVLPKSVRKQPPAATAIWKCRPDIVLSRGKALSAALVRPNVAVWPAEMMMRLPQEGPPVDSRMSRMAALGVVTNQFEEFGNQGGGSANRPFA